MSSMGLLVVQLIVVPIKTNSYEKEKFLDQLA